MFAQVRHRVGKTGGALRVAERVGGLQSPEAAVLAVGEEYAALFASTDPATVSVPTL